MNPLAVNPHISRQLKPQYTAILAALPFGLMFLSIALLFKLTDWLSIALDIPDGVPVKDQPNGLLFMACLLGGFAVLMIGGYLLGWVLNAVILRFILRWPGRLVSRAIWFSELPSSWLRASEGATSEPDSVVAAKNMKWEKARQQGRWNFVFKHGILSWGLTMYVALGFVPVILGKVNATAYSLIWQAVLWAGAGAIYGLAVWYFSERSFIASRNSKSP